MALEKLKLEDRAEVVKWLLRFAEDVFDFKEEREVRCAMVDKLMGSSDRWGRVVTEAIEKFCLQSASGQ
jgi:hypothetical protein